MEFFYFIMLKVGITGGIGSGKSVVAKMFSVLGVPVFDADKEAKKIMIEDDGVRQQLIAAFGPQTFQSNGLNRAYLASVVFADAASLEKLNSIVHPAVIRHADQWFNRFNTAYVMKEAALIFESGSARGLDYIIGVTAPTALRLQRVMKRDGISREEVTKRMQSQLDDGIKMKLCDFVVFNDERHSVIEQVLGIHTRLLRLV